MKIKLDLQPLNDEKLDLQPVEKTKLDLQPIETPQKLDLQPLDDLKLTPLDFTAEGDRFAKMSKFGKVLDILGRPGYAMKSMMKANSDELKEIMDRPDLTENEKIKLMEHQQLSFNEALSAAWKGFSGQERITANELWDDLGVKGVPLLGFISEIAVDPLMMAGGAGYKAITDTIGKTLGVTKKILSKMPGVAKASQFVASKAEPITTALKDMFINKTGLKKLNELIDQYLLKRQYMKGQEIKFGVKTRNVIQNISTKTGQSVDDIEKQVVSLIEQPNAPLEGIATEIKVLANTIKSHLSNMVTAEMKAGVPITTLSENARNIQYFPRITTKEAAQYLKQARIGNSKIWNPKIANALKRRTGDFTLDEFNSFVKEHGLESLGGRSVEEFFLKNPAYAVAIRGSRSAKAITSAEFLNDAGKVFGKSMQEAPQFWQALPESVTKLNPSLKGLKFDPEVASEIARTTKAYFNQEEIKTFLKVFDMVQNTWKRWTLAPFPKYHIRNMVGNLWNNYLAGVGVESYSKAQAIQMYRKYKNASGAMGEITKANLQSFGLNPMVADDIITQAEKTGVLGRGWFGRDIEEAIKESISGGKGLIAKGMALGTTIENNARLAHFIDKLDKGNDVLQSSMSVKRYLFDYGDLTDFEKQVMKRVFPFYTWTRKNIPLQLEELWKQPQKYAPLAISLRDRDPQDLLRLKYANPSLYERLPVELQKTIDTTTYVPLEGLLPAGDLTKLVRPQELLVELLSPYLKTPIELSLNKSFYREKEIQKYPQETQEFLRMDIPVKLKYLLTTVAPQARLMNEINKIIKKQVRHEELTIPEQAFSQALSSIYKVNLSDLRVRALQNIDKKIKDLEMGMFWAKRNLRPKEQEKIKNTYYELKKLMGELK